MVLTDHAVQHNRYTGLGGRTPLNLVKYCAFTTTTCAARFVFFLFFPPTAEEIAANNISLSDEQILTVQQGTEWFPTGIAYFLEQENKPNDIGLALYDNPVGQLAWIGGPNERSLSLLPYRHVPFFPLRAEWVPHQFEYTNALWPQEYVAKVGNLVSYTSHNFGGHFAGLYTLRLDQMSRLWKDLTDPGSEG
ncbi:hypothetical protein K438DRAFT_1758212 [Mycena galopus ATCC 62051]|nr:hypothetical protein K438DRAFT_1758212 [Mycena galopus ATCC 62051]